MIGALAHIGHQSSHPQGRVGVFNVGLCGVLDLCEALKGEEVTVALLLIASAIVSPFQGLGKR